jgi:hypothetical protein
MYNLTLNFNGETYTKQPKDVKSAIMSVKPQFLFTDVYVTLKDKQDVRERKLNLHQGRKLFQDENFLDVFVMNLLLK